MTEEDEKIIHRLKYYNDENHLAKRIVELQHCIEDLREENKEAHDFDETMKDIKDNLIARINRQEQEIERLNNELDYYKTKPLYIQKWELEREIERLNNIINKGIEAINVYQNEKTLSVSYENLKRIKGILRGNEFDLQMFEEYLQELKGDSSND